VIGYSPSDLLALQMRERKLSFVPEYRFHPTRRWRADFALPKENPRLLVEVEGGVWVQGRHQRGKGFEDDCEKYASAMMEGYAVLRVTPRQIMNMKAIDWIVTLLQKEQEVIR
jgi:very-short-patch-repair endonuclease